MIKLACNYSIEVMDLLKHNLINVDMIKYPSISTDPGFKSLETYHKTIKEIKAVKPVLYHGTYPSNIFIGDRDFIKKFDVDAFKTTFYLAGTKGISLHFSGGDHTYSRQETIDVALKNISYFKSLFPDLEFLTVENLVKTNNPFEMDADVFSEVVTKGHVGFVYDMSHAYHHCFMTGLDFKDYVSKLPFDHLYEMHLNGWQIKGDDLQAHMKIRDEFYGHIEEIATQYPVKIITLEYGRGNDRINCSCPVSNFKTLNKTFQEEVVEQVNRLSEIIERMNNEILCSDTKS